MRHHSTDGSTLPDRPAEGRVAGGVCAALATRAQLDVTLVRLAFLVLVLAWGVGLMVYGMLWLVLPDEAGASHALGRRAWGLIGNLPREASRGVRRVADGWYAQQRGGWPQPLSRQWLGMGLASAGAVVFLGSFGVFAWLTPLRALGLAAVFAGTSALISLAGAGKP